jgi:hypothetical protein
MNGRIGKVLPLSCARRLAAAALVVLSFTVLAAVPASAANPVPYTDFAAKGSVGLCDKTGNAVTSGKITDKPFVWFAVSSMAAPNGYGGTGRKATLVIYQPRPNTYPPQWSGDSMTSSSPYTNPRYPMAAASAEDFSLLDYINEFPPQLNGLLQLRIYYGAPQKSTWTETYAATDIKVTGSTWRVVRGASVPCRKGSAKPNEPYHIVASPSASTPPAGTSTPTPTASVTPTATSTSSATPSATGPGSDSPSPVAGAAAQVDSGSGSGVVPWLLGLGGLALLLGGGAWWYSRRSAVRGNL